MATLLVIRTALNGEIGVATDGDTIPWTAAVRNQAISDGYAALWRAGVWKDVKQDLATVTDQWIYALTSIRWLSRLEVLDSSSRVVDRPTGIVEPDGAGAWQLRLIMPVSTGYTLRVRGYTSYLSTFANDAAVDDLPAEHARIPRLKAKAILYRIKLADFARYENREVTPPDMNLSVGELMGVANAAESEFRDEARQLARLRIRTGRARGV